MMPVMSTPKITWKVAEPPSGRFRSFHKRGWPSAGIGPNSQAAISIYCEDDYRPARVKTGEHAELKVTVAEWFTREGNTPSFHWRTMKQRFATLDEAKKFATEWYLAHPNFWPPELQPKESA